MRILRSRHQSTRRALLGFTLIEVMIAVAVGVVAVPN
jgi:prepilin-type N-terminal cleavage/methylation domain-containing protein